MALLQIAEPGQAAAPHQHRLAVGIDLGTTNSLVASVRSGQSVILNDEQERSLVPSVAWRSTAPRQRLSLLATDVRSPRGLLCWSLSRPSTERPARTCPSRVAPS